MWWDYPIDLFAFRSYSVSKDEKDSWQDAMTFCDNLGLGLAMWDTTDSYDDLKEITDSSSYSNQMFDKPAWTALNNANLEQCDGCSGKLVNLKIIMNRNLPLMSLMFIFCSCGSRTQVAALRHSLAYQTTGASRGRVTRGATNSSRVAAVMWRRRSALATRL